MIGGLGKQIDEFSIALVLNASGIGKDIQKAVRDVQNGTKQVEVEARRLGEKINTLMQTTKLWVRGFYAFTASMSVAFYQYTKEAEAFGQTSKEIGLNVERLDALEKATIRAGGKAGDFTNSIKRLNDALTQTAMEGTSDLSEKLEAQGINGGEQGYKRNAYNVFLDIAKRAKEMGDIEGSYWLKSLGFSSAEIELLKKGDDEIRDIIHDMKELGVVNDNDAKLAKGFNDGMRDLWDSFRGVANIVFRMVLPPLNKFLEVGKNILNFLSRNERIVKMFFIGLAAVITTVAVPAFALLAKMILANPITWLIAGIAALALVLDDLFGWMKGEEAALGDFWAKLFGTDNPGKAKETFKSWKKSAGELFDAILSYLPDAITLWELFKEIIGLSFVPLMKLIDGFREARQVWEEISPPIKEGIEWIKNGFQSLSEIISTKFAGVLETAKKAWDNTIGQIKFPSFGGGETVETATKTADGGIFTRPTNALIGEAGAEAVIPFSPGKRNRGLELLSKIAGNLMPNISAAQALPMGGATTNNISTDTRVNVGNVTINAADGTDAANQFMSGIESRAARWTAAANVAY